MSLKVVVLREDAGPQELLLQDVHKIQQVLGLAAADVVHGIRRNGQPVVAGVLGRGFLHHAEYALDDVVYVGEVPPAVAVVVYLDGLALEELVGETEVGHVRAAGGAIDSEKAQACGRDVVQLAVAVGEELVAFLGGRV